MIPKILKKHRDITVLAVLLFTLLFTGSCNKSNVTPALADVVSYKTTDSGITVREAEIITGFQGDPVVIAQLSDLHFSGINGRDVFESDPALMSTYENRTWQKDGAAVANGVKCLEFAAQFDKTVITGDIMDYLSWGSLELLKTHIWEPYPSVTACIGNHDASRVCQAEVDDPTTLESRLKILQENWINDVFYSSEVIDGRVMIIQMDNGSAFRFWDCQLEPLKNDIELARQNNYTVLLFFHVPLCTKNPLERNCLPSKAYDSLKYNFYENGVGDESSDGATQAIYDVITNNADVIKGCFCGHLHSDYYTEIIAKTYDGRDTVIPQYVISGTPYDNGHVLKITVK